MSQENEALHRRFFDELINKGRPKAIDELLAPEWAGHIAGMMQQLGVIPDDAPGSVAQEAQSA